MKRPKQRKRESLLEVCEDKVEQMMRAEDGDRRSQMGLASQARSGPVVARRSARRVIQSH